MPTEKLFSLFKSEQDYGEEYWIKFHFCHVLEVWLGMNHLTFLASVSSFEKQTIISAKYISEGYFDHEIVYIKM